MNTINAIKKAAGGLLVAMVLVVLAACGGGSAPAAGGGVVVDEPWVRPAVMTGMSDAAMEGEMAHGSGEMAAEGGMAHGGGEMDHGSMGHGGGEMAAEGGMAHGGGGNSAAYMRLTNTGSQPDAIIGASTDVANIVELHNVEMSADGVMRMFPVEKIEIPAGGSAELKPGSFHVMLIDLKQDLNEGDEVNLTLQLESGGEIQVTAPVEQR